MFRATIIAAALGMVTVTAVEAQPWYGEVYGGGVLERSEDRDGLSFDLDAGTAFGVGVYNNVPGPLEFGLDIMRTDAGFKVNDASLESLSAMAVGRATFWSSGGMSAYVGAGLGAIRVTYDGGTAFPALSGDDTVFGGQLSLGIRYSLAAFQIFTELKHQRAFDDASIQGVAQSYATNSVIVGARFAF